MPNHYEVLGIPSDATQDEIKAAYRRKASSSHPDREGGDTELFKAVSLAYEALKSNVCTICEGKGYIKERSGPFVKSVPCPRCWS